MENKNNHCCSVMEHYVNQNVEIDYDRQNRWYALRLAESDTGTHQMLIYCPWCGVQLPKNLSEKWFAILENEYGITDPIFDDAEKVPEEFKTDEWWKKRGL